MKFIKNYIKNFHFEVILNLLKDIIKNIHNIYLSLLDLLSNVVMIFIYPLLVFGECLDKKEED